ncbi:MAG: ectoine/hydroxyectoine ABC transporter substrate-binding protein EhuB [Alphaproteobacteria bacterium]|nr:ectoine/hydroxyectoine ABC transporter substrate-binding protein EhuB [Alphaproteobacteria bacterium]MDA7982787.1 ectoine/hydroxyectoine ABC transporter substrate-binding protein EhuB [Alphaproteobacteria bacterium]MDA7984183.1 ectoine/hydroxyectoine ABC transporter substrate-binding protein EhuB [Alphaproteobacteria bacterium]MDA7987060.1 ectoine/hydroxyectoine ABC transporter substrate-binding protein EhuB [Alphaproteobacteria bacterium]MDA7988343.1 ectoine/hydroxyectoine ABC transporter s
MKKLATAFVGVVFALVSLAPAAKAQELTERVMDDGIRVAFFNFKPYAYVDESNELVGTDIELLTALIEQMGGNIASTQAIDWGALIPGVKSGRFDVIATGMFVTPKRCEEVRFSQPYFGIKNSFTILKGNPHNVTDYESVRDQGLKLGIVSGAAQAGHAELAGVPAENIVQLPDNPSGVAALRAGRIHAWAISSLGTRELVNNVPEQDLEATPVFANIGGQSVVSHGAFAFRPEDAAFVDKLDGLLADFVGSPAHIAIMEKYGLSADELPIARTEDLCAG